MEVIMYSCQKRSLIAIMTDFRLHCLTWHIHRIAQYRTDQWRLLGASSSRRHGIRHFWRALHDRNAETLVSSRSQRAGLAYWNVEPHRWHRLHAMSHFWPAW